MYKDEMIHLHQLLVYLMKFFMENGVSDSYFKEYMDAGVSPHHIHKTKASHKYAIFLLSQGIAHVLSDSSQDVPKSVSNRLEELAKRCKKELS